MFIPFFIYIKTNFSTYFPMYLSVHPVMPPFILLFCQHRAFTHYVSHCLIWFTTQSTLLSSCVLSIFAIITFVKTICSCVVTIIDSVSLFILTSLSHSHFSSPTSSSIGYRTAHVTSSVSTHYFAHFLSSLNFSHSE